MAGYSDDNQTDLRVERMNLVVDAIDGAATAGTLAIYTAAYASLLVSIELDDPCGTVNSSAVLTFSGTPLAGVAAATGTAALARIRDGDGNVVVNGLSVGTGSEDIVLSSTSINTSDNVVINTATITHSASV